jgi:hypothetical protein
MLSHAPRSLVRQSLGPDLVPASSRAVKQQPIRATVPAKTVFEFVAYAKANPGKTMHQGTKANE